jgi:hypothetical protein
VKHSKASFVVTGFVALAAVPAAADEQVSFEVQGKDTVLGTIRPSNESEAILGKLARGTKLKAAVKSTQKQGPVPTLSLRLADDTPVGGAIVAVKGRGAVLSPFAVTGSGQYKVVVSGDDVKDGDYQLVVNWTPQKTFTAAGTSAGDTTLDFSAPAGSKVSISLTAPKGSAFVPSLDHLEGPAAVTVPLAGGGKATGVPLPAGGDWTLHFKSDAADGPYKVKVSVTPPKVAKHKVDIRDKALAGAFTDGSLVIGSVLLPGEGGSVGVEGTGSPIDGSSVTVPPGSLGQTTSIFVAQAQPYTPPGSDHPAGPAVEFGPSGTEFDPDKPATVTIPFDPLQFPIDTSSLIVYVKDKNGVISPVLPTSSYVFGPNTVTFTTSHFSTFMAATSGSRGIPYGDYTWIEVSGFPGMVFSGSMGVGKGAAFINAAGFSMFQDQEYATVFSASAPSGLPAAQLDFLGMQINNGSVTQFDDTSFSLLDESQQSIGLLRRGLSDDVMVVEHVHNQLRVATALLLRRIQGRPTVNTLAGKWHAFQWEIRARDVPQAGGTTLPVSIVSDAGSAVISTTGEVTLKFPNRVTRQSDVPSGEWSRTTSNGGTVTATLSIDPDFIPTMQFAIESNLGFDVCCGGDVLVAKTGGMFHGEQLQPVTTGLLMLVRESSGVTAASVKGSYADVYCGLDLHTADGNPAPDPLGLTWRALTSASTVSDLGIEQYGQLCTSVTTQFDPTTFFTEVAPPPPVKFTVAGNGAVTVPSLSVNGAIGLGGKLFIYLRRDTLRTGVGFSVKLSGPN